MQLVADLLGQTDPANAALLLLLYRRLDRRLTDLRHRVESIDDSTG